MTATLRSRPGTPDWLVQPEIAMCPCGCIGKRKKGGKGPDAASKMPMGTYSLVIAFTDAYLYLVTPVTRCRAVSA